MANGGTLDLVNSTISGNSAAGSSHPEYIFGGAISNSGILKVTNCTIAGNSSANIAGGLFNGPSGTVTFGNTILKAGSSGANIYASNGGITSNGFNLSSDGAAGFFTQTGDQINTDPLLGPLQDNGGPTSTHALLPGSPAIDKGNTTSSTDQRGATRPIDIPGSANGSGNKADVGALEVQLPSFANISARLRVGTGDDVLIAGFIVTGGASRKIMVRAIGPSLPLADKLADPTLEFLQGNTLLEANDNWVDSPNLPAILATAIPPTNPLEAAIVRTVPAGAYTAVVRGLSNGTGTGVVEVYDLDAAASSKLVNISTRGLVQTGDNVLFAGTIVVGPAAQKLIIRALGPSVPVPGAMANPTLDLYDTNGVVLESNDNWVDSPNKQAIMETIPPTNNLESAILRTLTPGLYTAIVRGANSTAGIAVVEMYALP